MQARQLRKAQVGREIPSVPHWMVVRWRKSRNRTRRNALHGKSNSMPTHGKFYTLTMYRITDRSYTYQPSWKVRTTERRMRSASKKFRNSDATSRSCRKSRWNCLRGRTFHAIVSVTAVNIQFSSPAGVLRSVREPCELSQSSATAMAVRAG